MPSSDCAWGRCDSLIFSLELECACPKELLPTFVKINPDVAGESCEQGVGAVEFPVVKSQQCSNFTCWLKNIFNEDCWG